MRYLNAFGWLLLALLLRAVRAVAMGVG